MDIKEMSQWYDTKKNLYKELEGEAKYILEDALEEISLKYDRIESRIKKFNSLEDKVKRKNLAKMESLEEISDFLGVRVICLFLSDLDRVKKIIQNEFEIISEDNKLEEGNIDQFGYQSIHYIVKLKDNLEGRRYNKLKNNNFEIQVRTLAMHSWANISHHLSYKTNDSIPQILKKDFYALSALLHLVDKTFESISRESIKNKKAKEDLSKQKEFKEEEIDFDTLVAYLGMKLLDREKAKDDQYYSNLTTVLKEMGIKKLEVLDDVLDLTYDTLVEAEILILKRKHFRDTGVLNVVLRMITNLPKGKAESSLESKAREELMKNKNKELLELQAKYNLPKEVSLLYN